MKDRILWLLLFLGISGAFAQAPRALVVIAHPDDESVLSVTLYKLAKEQGATVDLFVITNGEAGYRYATLAESFYGSKLTDPAVGRRKLPAIRKKELREAGHILGIRNYYFADQRDSHYSLDEREPLDSSWNVPAVKKQLHTLLTHNHYDYVFCLLPETNTHAGHKAAALLALDAVAALPVERRSVILGAGLRNKTDQPHDFEKLKDYGLTQTLSIKPAFSVDRTASFSYQHKLNYKIIANWELAAHKSQGATQMTMNDGDLEEFWYFKINTSAALPAFGLLFSNLRRVPRQEPAQVLSRIN